METIILNDLIWDKENLSVDGNTYFTYQEAKIEAAKLGKRLPTKEEFGELFRLPHVWDEDKKGILLANIKVESKTEDYLYFPANGHLNSVKSPLRGVDMYGIYWSDTPYNKGNLCTLYFDNMQVNIHADNSEICFSVRCVQDINKSKVMETNQEIEFNIPEGYVIDNSKSTENKIVCKLIEPKYPESWNEAFISKVIKGFYVEGRSIEHMRHDKCTVEDKGTFKTEKQAASALAYAQLTQLMALPCYNGDWVPNWDDSNQEKYCITRMKYNIVKLDYSGYFSFLAFKSEKVRDAFFNNHMDLIKQFHQL